MKWYDYLACISCADMISAGLISGNIVLLLFGIVLYLAWENMRKWELGIK